MASITAPRTAPVSDDVPTYIPTQSAYLRSIRTPLLLVIVLSVIVPAVLVAAISSAVNINNATNRAYEQMETVSTLKVSQIGFWVNLLEDEANAIAVDDEHLLLVRQAEPNSAFPTLRDQAQADLDLLYTQALFQTTQFESLDLIANDGKLIAGTERRPLLFQPVDAPQPGEIVIIGPLVTEGELAMAAWYPVFDGDRFLAYFGGAVSMDALYDILQDQTGTGEGIETFLVDAEGHIIASGEDEDLEDDHVHVLGETTVDFMASLDMSDNSLVRISEFDSHTGEDTFGVVDNSLPLDTLLVTEQAENDVLNAAYLSVLGSAAVTFAAVLIVIVLGVFFIERRIVRPLKTLSTTANQVAGGNLTQRAVVNRADEIGVLATSFNTMTDQLQGLISGLEERVELRTRDLQLAADVSTKVTTELDPDQLLPELVEQVRSAFRFYHVSVFVYDPKTDTVDLKAATGEAGAQMLTVGRSFNLGRGDTGVVPTAAKTLDYCLANDVTKSEAHLPNPYLPDTRGELALPMIVGDQLVGILDLQSEQANRFQDDDIRVLGTLADQIAVAVRNAQLFEVVQDALASAEQANSVKSHFLASMSHELRTPLNAIINFTKFILKERMGPITERQADALDKVKTSGIHLLNLINDVLDISKIESGSLALIVDNDVDIPHLIDRAAATTDVILADKPVALKMDVAADLPPIIGDKQRILQVLLNLLSNACKFTEEGSISVKGYQDGDNVVVQVKDTGPGIAPEDHYKVFEAFQQTQTGLDQASGTGLGMPISRRLAEAHGGSLMLESAVGEGACFTLTLPIASELLEVEDA